jgi:hypothetical protein
MDCIEELMLYRPASCQAFLARSIGAFDPDIHNVIGSEERLSDSRVEKARISRSSRTRLDSERLV